MCPDWDILIEIQTALIHLPDLQLKFIKGHQDNQTPYAHLVPLLARLNVDADAMAGRFQDLHGQDPPLALITPRIGIQLHLLKGTVTSSHAATLRHACCGPPSLEYLRIKNEWSEARVSSINWQAHGSALGKQISHRIHFVKLVHHIFPTHRQQNRMDMGHRTCPCCHSLQEDRDHILQCPSDTRNKWRHTFLDKVLEACATNGTYAPLQQLLLGALRQWLNPSQQSIDHLPFAPYHVELHPLIRAQKCIGWRQLFNGRFCQQWEDIQNNFLYQHRQHLPTKQSSGKKWQVAMITVIWEQWYVLWKLRNNDVHGKDVAVQAIADKREGSR